MKKGLLTVIVSASLLAGCASSPDKMQASYVSPLKYKNYDCDQIVMEMDHIRHETTKLYSSLSKKASNDKAQMGLGLVLFWPALLFLEGGDGPEAIQYSQMKGEYEALRKASVQKKCSVDTTKSLDDIVKEKYEADSKAEEDIEEASDADAERRTSIY
jgi:hypothetical protein